MTISSFKTGKIADSALVGNPYFVPFPIVTGGTLTSDATYYYRKFTSNGSLTVQNGSVALDIILLGGGSGGGDVNGSAGSTTSFSSYTTPGAPKNGSSTGAGGNPRTTTIGGSDGYDYRNGRVGVSTWFGTLAGGGGAGGTPYSNSPTPGTGQNGGGNGGQGVAGSSNATNGAANTGSGGGGAGSISASYWGQWGGLGHNEYLIGYLGGTTGESYRTMRTASSTFAAGSYPVVIGAGGAGAPADAIYGASGNGGSGVVVVRYLRSAVGG